jgi:hypothetical protein
VGELPWAEPPRCGFRAQPVDIRPRRPTLVGLAILLLAACTGGGGKDEQAPTRPAGPSLQLAVVSIPLKPGGAGMADGCQVGGSGVAGNLGKVRVYSSVKLGGPRPDGCREATATGSLSGAGWSAPFAGGGDWCGQRAQLAYRLNGPEGPQGRLECRDDPPAAPTATFTGALPAPSAAQVARDPARRADSAGCGRRAPVRPGWSGDLHDVSGLSELGDRLGFLAVYPQGLAIGAGRSFWAAAGRTPTVEWPLPMPPVPNWLADWATRDGCPGEPAVFLDTPDVSGFRWSGCRDGAEVVHYRINGGDHEAPRAIDGRPFAEVVWEFLGAHPLGG